MRHLIKGLTLVIIPLLILAGCAATLNYGALERHMRAGDCELAASVIREKDYGFNMKLNYLLDAAFVNMLCGKYRESNRFFHEAEDLAEKLWTKSITMEATAFVTNEYALPYHGEDFERALINLFSAINYVMLGDFDEALVECRRLDSLLTLYNDKYDRKNVYKEDAFGRYLSGIIYEAQGNLDDAFIDYLKAYKAFRDYENDYGTSVPASVREDLLRVAGATGRLDEVMRETGGIDDTVRPEGEAGKGRGKLVLIQLNGKSPVKVDDRVIIATRYGPVSIAFPRYVVSRPECGAAELTVRSATGRWHARAELVEDINEIAVKNLEDRKGRVVAKTIARVVAKRAAINSATEDPSMRRILNLLDAAFIEKADTRSWRTLPGEIYLSRVFLPEGRYKLYVNHCGNERYMEDIGLKAGETRFLLFNSMYE